MIYSPVATKFSLFLIGSTPLNNSFSIIIESNELLVPSIGCKFSIRHDKVGSEPISFLIDHAWESILCIHLLLSIHEVKDRAVVSSGALGNVVSKVILLEIVHVIIMVHMIKALDSQSSLAIVLGQIILRFHQHHRGLWFLWDEHVVKLGRVTEGLFSLEG